jgi:hypothetical protein
MSLLILAANLYGQASYTTVTATLTDSNSQIWSGATVIATLRPAPNNPGLPLNNGLAITDSPQTVVTNGAGLFTLILDNTNKITPAGALWTFTIYPNATVTNGSSISLPITGTAVNLSGVLSSILIPPAVFAAPSVNRAYSSSEVTGGSGGLYWDTTANVLKGCYTVGGGACSWTTIGNIGVPGFHYYIPYNNGIGGFTANINLQFNDATNTFATYNATLSGTLGLPLSDGCLNIASGIVGSYLCVGGTPTITVGPGAGNSSGGTAVLNTGSLDKVGGVAVHTGTSTLANSTILTVRYSTPFTTLSSCTVTQQFSADVYGQPISILSGTAAWLIYSGTPALDPSTTYIWYYICQGY